MLEAYNTYRIPDLDAVEAKQQKLIKDLECRISEIRTDYRQRSLETRNIYTMDLKAKDVYLCVWERELNSSRSGEIPVSSVMNLKLHNRQDVSWELPQPSHIEFGQDILRSDWHSRDIKTRT